MRSLHGVGVLVTRPAAQAQALCELLQERGAVVERLAALDIIPTPDSHALASRVGRVADFDLAIFTSTNAVRYGSALLHDAAPPIALAAIGPATIRALHAAGHRVAIEPAGGSDSEALLRHPRLLEVDGARVLIVKGVGGRDMLAAELARRGAQVTCADVYERRASRASEAHMSALAQRIAAAAIRVVTATSLDIARHLLASATPELRAAYQRVHWLVPSARVADGIRQLDCDAPQIRAVSADDHDLIRALEAWQSGQHGGQRG